MQKWVALFSLILSVVGHASTATENQSARSWDRLGLSLAAGEPFGSEEGVTVDYNIFDFTRISASIGRQTVFQPGILTWSYATVFNQAVGLELFVPHWNFSPVAGIHLAWSTIGGFGAMDGYRQETIYYYSFGLDWQTLFGFTVGSGINLCTEAIPVVTYYAHIGWHFDFFNY